MKQYKATQKELDQQWEWSQKFCKGLEIREKELEELIVEYGNKNKKNLHSELKSYAQWYQMDELQRDEPERFDTIIDRYIEQRK